MENGEGTKKNINPCCKIKPISKQRIIEVITNKTNSYKKHEVIFCYLLYSIKGLKGVRPNTKDVDEVLRLMKKHRLRAYRDILSGAADALAADAD